MTARNQTIVTSDFVAHFVPGIGPQLARVRPFALRRVQLPRQLVAVRESLDYNVLKLRARGMHGNWSAQVLGGRAV
ncbi:MAG TPA: hypothetical protein VME20_02285 [Acidimicrobiales bacterium]|nr:hypothetical protein [Acidimicrobiales bacterium]